MAKWIPRLAACLMLGVANGVLFGSGGALSAFAAGSQVSLTPASVVVAAGQQATLDVVISTDEPVRGVQMQFRYDPKVIQVDSVTEGTFFSTWADANGARANLVFPFTPDNVAGETKVGGIALFGGPGGQGQGASGSGTLLTIHLTGLSGASGTTSALDMNKLIVADTQGQAVSLQVTAATVAVGQPSTSPPPAPTPFAIAAPPRPAVAQTSPWDTALVWLRRNQVWLGILGGGLVSAAVLYLLVARLTTRAGPPSESPRSAPDLASGVARGEES